MSLDDSDVTGGDSVLTGAQSDGSGGGGGGTVKSVTTQDATASNQSDPTRPIINEATPTNGGTISAANEGKVEAIASPGWFDAQVNLLSSAVPGLTAFEYIKLGQYPFGGTLSGGAPGWGTGLKDGNLQGGSAQTDNSGVWSKFTGHVIQDPLTQLFALAWRGPLGAPGAGLECVVGLVNDANNQLVGSATINATSATNFVLSIVGPGGATTNLASTVAYDAGQHDHQVYSNGANVIYRIDGLIVATAPLTNLPQQPCSLGTFASVGRANNITKLMYGYVAG